MIWRDDDILKNRASLRALLDVDDLLQRHGQIHTVAIIASTLTPELAAIIRARGMSAQLHCWKHDDLSVNPAARAQLAAGVAKIADLIGVRPTILYPTWNRTSAALMRAAAELGLIVCHQKISLEQYIRFEGDVDEPIVNFHYWHEPDRGALAEALAIATELRA